MQDYYCYVLLDFITADRDLEEYPLAAALTLTEELGLKDRFSEIAREGTAASQEATGRRSTSKKGSCWPMPPCELKP